MQQQEKHPQAMVLGLQHFISDVFLVRFLYQ